MFTIRTDDMVEVISGNDKGKRGKILKVLRDKNRVVVQGVNLRWKHLRKSQKHPQGGRDRREAPIHMSNVMVFDEGAGTRTRIGFREIKGKKVRISRKTGNELGRAAAAKAEPEKKARKAKQTAKKTTKSAEKKE